MVSVPVCTGVSERGTSLPQELSSEPISMSMMSEYFIRDEYS